MFGERDSSISVLYYNGSPNMQIGSETNLFDFTRVGNFASAHRLTDSAPLRASAPPSAIPGDAKVDGKAVFVTNMSQCSGISCVRCQMGWVLREMRRFKVSSPGKALVLPKVSKGAFSMVGKNTPLTEKLVYNCCMTAYSSIRRRRRDWPMRFTFRWEKLLRGLLGYVSDQLAVCSDAKTVSGSSIGRNLLKKKFDRCLLVARKISVVWTLPH
jgi:hypothetical protein